MTRPYYTLLLRDAPAKKWVIEFGAYNRDDVAFERDEAIDNGAFPIHPANTKIIRTSDKQADIDAVVAELNERKI